MKVDVAEFIGIKYLANHLTGELKRIENGEVEKLLVMRHTKPIAVVLTVEQYEKLAAEK